MVPVKELGMKDTINRKQPPLIKDAIEFNLQLKPYEKFVLDNGIEVFAINAGAEDVLQIEWVFYAGNWFEERNLIAAITNFLLKNGTSEKSAFKLNEHFEYYGAYLNRTCYNETSTISLHSLSKHLGVLLPVIRELISDSVFPEDEISIYQQNMKQRLNVNLKKCDFVAHRLIDKYIYGEEHPYGRFTRFEDFDSITREELLKFYEQYYQNGKLVIFVAGKLPPDTFSLLNQYFGNLKNQPIKPTGILTRPAEQKKISCYQRSERRAGSYQVSNSFSESPSPGFFKSPGVE